ncbi:hypothetical protein ABT115_15790 [Streptomyces sp. NPDC001832]|uniref:hypothetical protein n=1 Tax=Streptomyces sp. NPDC001832 TaxID=3154527 RepID=UPI0033179538
MTLNQDEREILRLITEASEPVAASDFFHIIYPPNFDVSVGEEHPDRVVWQAHQFDLYRAPIELWPDLVEVTDAGRAALT